MKMGLTEKQYKHILSKLSEQSEAEPVKAEPEAGTSSTQSGGTGYPEVGKWESGITRGPANQVGVTKWSDVVGSKLTRSKANQLKEQNNGDWGYGFTPLSPIAAKQMREKTDLSHTDLTILSLVGLIPHPATMLASAVIMAIDAHKYETEGNQKTANLMYIFAAMGAYSGVLRIPWLRNWGAKAMAQIAEKISKGVKLLPAESEIVKKIAQNKDMIVQQLNKLKQSKVVQKTGEASTKVVDKYKNSKFSNSRVGKVTNTLAPPVLTYGGVKVANDFTYDLYKSNREKEIINNLAKNRK
jgi:hypothetical protein